MTEPAPPPAPDDAIRPTAPPVARGGEHDNDVVTITFAAEEHERALYEPLIEQFNAQTPEIQVQFVSLDDIAPRAEPFDYDAWQRQVVSGADTAIAYTLETRFITRGYLRDLTPFIDTDPTFGRDDFYPGALNVGRLNEGIYLLPHTLQVPLLAYNKDLWVARGLDPPHPDWNWYDLLDTAGQLVERQDDTIEVYGLLDELGGWFALQNELATAGIHLSTTPAEQVDLTDPASAAVLEHLRVLVTSGIIYANPDTDMYGFDPEDFRPLIRDQRIGMWFAGNYTPEDVAPAFTIGIAPYPVVPGISDHFYGTGYIMSAGTQHPQAAWRWLSFLSRNAIVRPSANQVGVVPARQSVAAQSGYWEQLDQETAAAVQAVLARPAAPPAPNPPLHGTSIAHALRQALQAVLRNRQDATQALQNAQVWLEHQLAQTQLTPQPTPAAEPVLVSTPVPQAPAAAAMEDNFHIRFGTQEFGFNYNQMAAIVDAFNARQSRIVVDLKAIDLTPLPAGGRAAPATIPEAATTATDCFAWPTPPTPADLPALRDLQPLLDADPTLQREDYPPALLAPFQHQGGLYGLPYTAQLRVLNYNQTAFDQAGLADPSADWTLDDFLQAAQQLTSGTGDDAQYGFASVLGTQDLRWFLDRAEAALTTGTGEALQPNFTDPTVVAVVRGYLDLLRTTSPHQQLDGYRRGDDWNSTVARLVEAGQVGMWLGVGTRSIEPAAEARWTRAIAPPVLGTNAVSAQDVQVSGLYISATTEHAEACWTWLQYLGTTMPISDDGFPARVAQLESFTGRSEVPPGAADVYTAYQAALEHLAADEVQTFFHPPDQAALDYFWFYRAVDRALQGADLEHELAEAQFITEQYLACLQGGEAGGQCARAVDPEYAGRQTAGP